VQGLNNKVNHVISTIVPLVPYELAEGKLLFVILESFSANSFASFGKSKQYPW